MLIEESYGSARSRLVEDQRVANRPPYKFQLDPSNDRPFGLANLKREGRDRLGTRVRLAHGR